MRSFISYYLRFFNHKTYYLLSNRVVFNDTISAVSYFLLCEYSKIGQKSQKIAYK